MRRAVPALAAVLALALVVGCGGDDSEEPADQGSQPQQEAKQGGDLTMLYAADVDYIDPGHHVLPVRVPGRLRDAAAAVLVQARRRDQPGARPRRGAARDLRGRQDRHGHDPHGRQVQPAGEPGGDLGRRQVRDRARLQAPGRRPVRGRLHGRPRGPEGVPGRQGRRDQRHHDAGRPDDRLQARASARRDPRRSAVAAGVGAGAEGVRAEVRPQAAVGIREQPGGHRPVHGRERRVGQAHRLHPRRGDQARPQPELGRVDRLQAGVPGLDHDQGGQRARRGVAPDPRGQRAGVG